MLTYQELNAELNLPQGGAINIKADKQAARAYHLDYVNKHTRFFHSLREKTDYMLENNLWNRETVEMYPFKQFKALFNQCYAYKFRFQTLLGAMKFYSTYALKDKDGETILERFEDRVVMVAIHLSQGDYSQAQDLVDIIITGRFQPATPTFLNAGRARGGEMVSCFLLRTEDNMESIGRMINSALQLSKRGGGVGILLTNLRESGAPIKGIPNTSSGVVPVMKILEDSFSYANQLGQRQGAGAVYLNAHHPDIMTFLDTKRENADEKIRIKTLSLGVVIPDITFYLAKKNDDMYLFSPYDVERVEGKPFADCSVTECYHKWVEDERIHKTKIKARDFFRTLSEIQFESGYPYVLFEDTANKFHTMKHVGKINMSNLCSEIAQVNTPSVLGDDISYQTIGHDISCNLGSLNIKKMMDCSQTEFVDTVIAAVRALDAVSRLTNIDSVPSVRDGNKLSRAIGLGQMNLHGALAHNNIMYGTPEALELWDNYMALITWAAMLASSQIAKDKGATPYYDGSEYDTGEWWNRVPKEYLKRVQGYKRGRTIIGGLMAPGREEWNELHIEVSKYGLANAYLQTIPPTGSISYINNSTSSIHPIVNKVEIRKEGKVGRVYYPAPHMRTDNLNLYKNAYELGYRPIIDTYAVSQRWVDQSQSLTLFFPDTATTRDLDKARIYAWTHGIKSLYYMRLRQIALDGTKVAGTGVEECTSCML
ncbi:class 1b ribonucleoside-diphosphate reductase subunit alpha [Corynebacterium pyruviciproducens]